MKPVSGSLVWKGKRWQVRIRQGEEDVYLDLETTDEALGQEAQAARREEVPGG